MHKLQRSPVVCQLVFLIHFHLLYIYSPHQMVITNPSLIIFLLLCFLGNHQALKCPTNQHYMANKHELTLAYSFRQVLNQSSPGSLYDTFSGFLSINSPWKLRIFANAVCFTLYHFTPSSVLEQDLSLNSLHWETHPSQRIQKNLFSIALFNFCFMVFDNYNFIGIYVFILVSSQETISSSIVCLYYYSRLSAQIQTLVEALGLACGNRAETGSPKSPERSWISRGQFLVTHPGIGPLLSGPGASPKNHSSCVEPLVVSE